MRDLVRRAQCGDPAASASLVAEWEPLVRRVVRRLISDPFDADDVIQESLLSALLRMGQLRDAGRSAQWLSSIARNAAVSCIREPRVQCLLDDVADATLPEGDSQVARMRLLVRVATANLSAMRREAIIQHYYRGLSYVETADATGVSVDTVRSRLQKARNALKEAIHTMAQGKPERYTLSGQDLSTLQFVVEATTVDERHPELQGILLDTGGWAVATDGRRLIKRRIAGLRQLSVPILLGPWRGADALFRSGGASLLIHGEVASFQAESGTSHDIGVMDAQFPNYQSVIPNQEPICSFVVTAGSICHALGTLVPEPATRRNAVTVEVADGVLALRVRWPEYGSEGTIRLVASECSCDSGLFTVCIEARFMESAVRGLQPADNDPVRVSLYGERRPVLFVLSQLDADIALVAPLEPAAAA
jgi:RNA polymerase sigma-70 factor (ECF subfamily)